MLFLGPEIVQMIPDAHYPRILRRSPFAKGPSYTVRNRQHHRILHATIGIEETQCGLIRLADSLNISSDWHNWIINMLHDKNSQMCDVGPQSYVNCFGLGSEWGSAGNTAVPSHYSTEERHLVQEVREELTLFEYVGAFGGTYSDFELTCGNYRKLYDAQCGAGSFVRDYRRAVRQEKCATMKQAYRQVFGQIFGPLCDE